MLIRQTSANDKEISGKKTGLLEIKLRRLFFSSLLTRHRLSINGSRKRETSSGEYRVTKLPFQMWAAGELSYTWSLLEQRVYRQTESTVWESIHLIIQAQPGSKICPSLLRKSFPMNLSLYNSADAQLGQSNVNKKIHLNKISCCCVITFAFTFLHFYGYWYHRSKEKCDSQICVVSSGGSWPQRLSSITTFPVPWNVCFFSSQ